MTTTPPLPQTEDDEFSAHYTKIGLPMYDGNPLIEALPPIMTADEVIEKLNNPAPYSEENRKLPKDLRLHAVQILNNFFQPLDVHVDLEGKISRMIRYGYCSRSPLSKKAMLANITKAANAVKKLHNPSSNGHTFVTSTNTNTTLIGTSGMGKTTATASILNLYPQVIQHKEYNGNPLEITQLVWLKLECPHDGSIKHLCKDFFTTIDGVLGTTYSDLYKIDSKTVDGLITPLCSVALQHHLGLLVVDEIQHLSSAQKGGAQKMLSFFTTLTNVLNIPMLIIGTPKAKKSLLSQLRYTRRGSGQGEMTWGNMKKDESWDIFISELWRYQFTAKPTPLTEGLSDALYDECQGITDFAIKIYILVQVYAITSGAEIITEGIIKHVAREDFQSAQFFLNALREGNRDVLEEMDDIVIPNIDDAIDSIASSQRRGASGVLPISNHTKPVPKVASPPPASTPPAPAESKKATKSGKTEKKKPKEKLPTGYEALHASGRIADSDDFLIT